VNVNTYDSASAFFARTKTLLERREAANCLMLGVAQRIIDSPAPAAAAPLLMTVEEGQEVVLAALMTPPHRLQIQSFRAETGTAMRELAQALTEQGWNIPGVMGEPELAQAFVHHWCALAGRNAALGVREHIYELRKVLPPKYSPGEFHAATETDCDLVTTWTLAFLEEAVPDDPGDEAGAQDLARRKIQAGDVFLWRDGVEVSMAHKTRPTAHGMCINMVYTPPAFRRPGYAASCVARLSQVILDSGKDFCCLFTDLANPISNSIYQRIGYQSVGDIHVYNFTT